MLVANNVTVGYKDAEIVRDVSFSLSGGEIIALLGANGAGKTTLLRALNGMIPVKNGEILFENKAITLLSRNEIARKITVVAQENETRFPVTVLEFVLGARFAHGSAFGWESERDIALAVESLQICKLGEFQNRLMNELSGGERQRALFARAIATEAQVLLLDEPTNNLDIANQALLFRLVKERTANFGAGAIVITHDLNLAAAYADRLLLLEAGNLVANGTPREVLTNFVLEKTFGVKVLVDENPQSGKVRVTSLF
ncbi:MAG: ABC transporter ATP-binding protein [Pyrinomonadaceae bacterium]